MKCQNKMLQQMSNCTGKKQKISSLVFQSKMTPLKPKLSSLKITLLIKLRVRFCLNPTIGHLISNKRSDGSIFTVQLNMMECIINQFIMHFITYSVVFVNCFNLVHKMTFFFFGFQSFLVMLCIEQEEKQLNICRSIFFVFFIFFYFSICT